MSDPARIPPRTPVPIRVVVCEGDKPGGAVIHDRFGDHNDRDFRDWMTDTMWWALRHGKTFVSMPATMA